MEITEQVFKPILVTRGRKTGREHKVMLRAVSHDGKVYFSRHKPDGDWFQNALANPDVVIQYKGMLLSGKACLVTDRQLNEVVSELKYPGEERAKEHRVTIEVVLD